MYHKTGHVAVLLMLLKANIVSHELVRVAILWHEMWHEGLEEASRLYFTNKDPHGMIAFLEPLHKMIEDVSPPHPWWMFP